MVEVLGKNGKRKKWLKKLKVFRERESIKGK